jgi:hypothetical protein
MSPRIRGDIAINLARDKKKRITNNFPTKSRASLRAGAILALLRGVKPVNFSLFRVLYTQHTYRIRLSIYAPLV